VGDGIYYNYKTEKAGVVQWYLPAGRQGTVLIIRRSSSEAPA